MSTSTARDSGTFRDFAVNPLSEPPFPRLATHCSLWRRSAGAPSPYPITTVFAKSCVAGWRLKSRLEACGHEAGLRRLRSQSAKSVKADFAAATPPLRRGFNRRPARWTTLQKP